MLKTPTIKLLVIAASLQGLPVSAEPVVVGWIEEVAVNRDFVLHAKIDSGADNSSLNMVDPQYYEKDGQRRVRFSVTNRDGEQRVFDKPIVDTTRIKRKDGGYQHRDVVEINLCLGPVNKRVRANLVDRSHFSYQLLVGRSFLSDDFLIDPSNKYRARPNCDANMAKAGAAQ